MKPLVSLLYAYFNTPDELLESIRSIPKAIGKISYEIIIIDNASEKRVPEILKKNKKLTIIRNKKNVGYGAALNKGARYAKGEYLLFLNPDTVFHKDAIKLMVNRMRRDKRIGILGPQLLDEKNKVLSVGSGFPVLPNAIFAFSLVNKIWPTNQFSRKYWLPDFDRKRERFIDATAGASMLTRSEIFRNVGMFDENFFLYFEENDICYRIRKMGYKVLYFPQAKITHLVGRSTNKYIAIKSYYERSRFYFLQKYHGFIPALLAEGFIRYVTFPNIFLVGLIALSAVLNTFALDKFMLLIGDMGRDYLAARQMLVTGNIPLVGIPSSVVWLHQGPLSIYFIALSFIFSNNNPIAPAVVYGLIGVGTVFLVYLLGSNYFNYRIGLLAALFYATSPLVVVNARMPYHTAPIPFFTALFFLFLYYLLTGNRKIVLLLFFILGLLLQLELSNAVLFFILLALFILKRPQIKKEEITHGVIGFLLGILPFILYDITHNFSQTLGFPLWIINRIRLFFGLTLDDKGTTSQASNAVGTVWDHLSRIIFPISEVVVFTMLGLVLFALIKMGLIEIRNNNKLQTILLWLIIPILGFIIHAAPAPAYFPFIYIPVSLLIGYAVYFFAEKMRLLYLLFFIGVVVNCYYLITNNFFVTTTEKRVSMNPGEYSFGISYQYIQQASAAIVDDANGKEFTLNRGGFLQKYPTSDDNYLFFIYEKNGKVADTARITYTVYENSDDVPIHAQIIYKNTFITVTKYDK
jgi:GT2 family glycosyltransferase